MKKTRGRKSRETVSLKGDDHESQTKLEGMAIFIKREI
jgi:hypothetical protein